MPVSRKTSFRRDVIFLLIGMCMRSRLTAVTNLMCVPFAKNIYREYGKYFFKITPFTDYHVYILVYITKVSIVHFALLRVFHALLREYKIWYCDMSPS